MNTTITVDRAISVRQPWAWLIVAGVKDIENRTWRTNCRGPVAIHASKTANKLDLQDFEDWFREQLPNEPLPVLHRRAIIGIAYITDCVEQSDSDWFGGPYGFVLDTEKAIEFEEPIPMNGKLSIFKIEPITITVESE